MKRPSFGARRWPALVMVALVASMPVAALTYGLGGDEVWSKLRQGAVAEPEGWRGGPLEELLADTMEGDDSLLRMLDHIGATPETAKVPVQSHVLGGTALPEALPGLYEARALSSSVPLREALVAYNAALDLMDAQELLASADLRMADELPFEAQVAIAVLLYAIADASLLQKQAVAGLSPEDYTALMGLPGMILSGRLDPTDSSEGADEDFAAAYGLLSQVDKQRIDEAALIMVHSVSHALPTLRDWAERERAGPQDPRVAKIGSLLDPYTPERIEAMDPIERLDILADTLRMAAGFQEVEISPFLQPLAAPDGPTPLRDSILGLATVLGRLGMPLDVVEERELQRADGLPRSLQVAVARIVTNQAAVVEASLDLNEVVAALESSVDPDALTDPESIPDLSESQRDALVHALGDLRRAEVRTVLAVQESAPTLEAWGLVWARDPSMLSSLPGQEHRLVADAAALADAMADPAVALQQVVLRASQSKGLQTEVEEPPLPPHGTLGPAVLRLYDRLGVEATAQERDAVTQGAMALPEPVERNVARVLTAQLEALDELDAIESSLSPTDRLALVKGSVALAGLFEGELSLRDVQSIRAYYDVADRVDGAFLAAAARVAAAVDASSRDLAALVDETPGDAETEEETSGSRPWYSTVWSVVTSIQIIGTASAQSGPGEPIHVPPVCPGSAVSDCGNDVWFMDPVLRTVVVSGFDPTDYTPQKMGGDGQILSVALGGDDVYQNNAGGTSGQIPVAVALDLGGDDRYLPAPDGFSYDFVQGAAAAGIGILYDRRGDDRYVADVRGQGFGGPGVALGVLFDGDGDDRYAGGMEGQGTGRGVGILVDLEGGDQHSRTHSDGSSFGDGECWTSARAPEGEGYDIENEPVENPSGVPGGAGVFVPSFANDTVLVATGGHGVFVDRGAAGCTVAGSEGLDPDSLEEFVGSILGSEYLLEIPAVLVIGDEGDTHYPGCEVEGALAQWAQRAASGDACDWLVMVDLGGNDAYENRAGGLVSGTTAVPGVLVDVRGDDLYDNTLAATCVQGCNSLLVDLDGDDRFIARSGAHGVASANGMSGILFDAAGNDAYTITELHQGRLAQGSVDNAAFGIGSLLDLEGDDVYHSPTQGVVDARMQSVQAALLYGAATAVGGASALFLDFAGDDAYLPADRQGEVKASFKYQTEWALAVNRAAVVNSRGSGVGAFLDASGEDRYVGTLHGAGPDMSSFHNNRFQVDAHFGARTGTATFSITAAADVTVAPGLGLFWDLERDDVGAFGSQVMGFQQPGDLHDAAFRIGPLGIAVGTVNSDLVHEDHVLFIDPGGDDTYRNNAGGTVLRVARDTTATADGSTPFREGGLASTTYHPDRNYPLAALVIDLDGDDLYAPDDALDPDPSSPPTKVKGILTQGAGFLGTGILVDEAGNPAATAAGAAASGAADDTYIARAMSQGFGLYGWGLLWDRVGNDRYRYEPAVVRDPVLDGNLLAWLQYGPAVAGLGADGSARGASDGMWEMHMRSQQWTRDCRIVVPGHEQGTFHGLTVAREAETRLGFSVYDADSGLWRLYQVGDFNEASHNGNPCSGGTITLAPAQHMTRQVEEIGGSDRPPSNQVNPQFVQMDNIDSILWQDDRDGTWSFYHKRLSHAVDDPAIPLGNGMLGGNDSRASNQQNPFVHGSHLVYQDDRRAGRECPEGTSSIHRLNLNTLQEEQISQGCGIHVNPQMSGSFVVWQTRPSVEDAWDVAVYDVNKEVPRNVTAPGDQYEPVVADTAILYTDAHEGHRIMQYDWDNNQSRVERFDAFRPALDRQAPFRAAWVDITGRDATAQAPARSGYWEMHRKDLSSEALPEADGIRRSSVAETVSSRWMTGASYANGRGIVFDEGGLDTYVGDRFSQGSAASLVGPSTTFRANGASSVSEVDAFGALVDGDGNDAYSARRESQGVHFAREIVAFIPVPPPIPGMADGPPIPERLDLDIETTASLGMLLDVRGNDRFDANRNSQGYGAWAHGAGTTVDSCRTNPPNPGCWPYRVWASQSYGLFMDLGGLDTYRYPQSLYQEVSVQDDFCGTGNAVAVKPLRSLLVGHNDTLRDTVGGFNTVGAYDEDGEPMSPPPPADVAEAEAELFDEDEFYQDFNDTLEQPLWSIFEGLPDEVLEQVPQGIRDELDKTVFQALEDGVDGILGPLVEMCHEVEGLAMGQKDATEEELRGEPAGESGERNNAVWRQKPRGGLEDAQCQRGGGRGACPTPFVLGGVGTDLPLMDNLNRALMDVANALIEAELQVSATDQDERLIEPGDPLNGTVKLIANVTFTDSSPDLGLEFDRAEFFADRGSAFKVLGTVGDFTTVGDRALFIRPWHTDSEEFPDGAYDLRTRVHYRHPASGFNLGYAQNETDFVVDNLPRILPDAVLPMLSDSKTQAPITEFSPFPFGDDQIPGHPVVTFGVSSDHAAAAQGHDGYGWVRIDVVDESEGVKDTLVDGTIDSDGTVSQTWSGTDDARDVVPSGRYLMRIQVTDRDPGDWVDAVRVRNLTAPLVVYSNTPHTGCVSSSLNPGCNAGAILNVQTGQVDASGVLRVPLALDAVGDPGDAPPGLEEIRRYHVRLGQGPVDDVTWQDPQALGVGASTFDLRIQDGEIWHVLALAEDRAGNLECAPVCAQRTDASVVRGDDATLLAAFAKKLEILEDDAFATFSADLQRPSIRNAKVFVGGEVPTSLVPRIGPDALVTVTYQVEEENGEPNPILEWWHEEAPQRVQFPDNAHPAVTIDEGECAQALRTCYVATWQGWSGLVDTEIDPWREGIVKVRLGAEDPALNPVRARDQPTFEFLLDRTAPTIDDVRVVYPEGRFHAEQGDEIRIVIEASDPILSGFLTQARDLSLAVADATTVTGASEVEGTCTLRFESGLCFQSQLKAWETVVPIDDTAWAAEPDLRAGRFNVAIDVTDVAGNTQPLLVELVLGAPRLAPELDSQETGVYNATTAWTTDGETDAYLLYGEGSEASDLVHRINSTVGSLHEFTLDDLQPGRSHVYRFVAIDPESEALEAGPLTTFHTMHGVGMELATPSDPGEVLSGLYEVSGDGWVQSALDDDNLTIEPRVVLRLSGPALPDAGRVVFDGFTEEGEFAMDLVTDALPDGTYNLEATVSYLSEENSTVVEDLLVDNSAPRLTFVAPADEAILRESPDRLLVRVDENLTAINLTSVRFHVGGTQRSVDVEFHPDGDGHSGVLEVTGLPKFRAGIVALQILAQDMAGNPGFAGIRFLYDPDAPEAQADVMYPDGQRAARPGQWVTITFSDEGIARVAANGTILGGPSRIDFTRDGMIHTLELEIPADTEGTYPVPVHVYDAASNVRVDRAEVVVDATPPEEPVVEFQPAGAGAAIVHIESSESVIVVIEAVAQGLDNVLAIADDPALLHVMEVEGVQAGVEYDVEVRVRDAAGNEAVTKQAWRFLPELGDVPAVYNLTAAASPHQVRLGWDDVGLGFRYAVHRAQAGAFETVGVANQPAFTDGVESGEYRYFVQALDAQDRHGAPSRIVDVHVQAPQPESGDEAAAVSVHPKTGVAGVTEFVFTARLQGTGEAEPSVWLVLGDETRRMSKDVGEDCTDSCTFRHATVLPEIDLRKPSIEYHVEVFDASGSLRLPAAGNLEGPTVLAREGLDAAAAEGEAPGLGVLFVLATLAIIVLVRRRNPL